MTRCFVAVLIAIAALASTQAALAAGGWEVVSWSSETSRWSPAVYVSGYDRLQARLHLRASRRMPVRINVSIRCYDAGHTRTVRRVLPTLRRWVNPTHPLVRIYSPTFPEASSCNFTATAVGSRGRLSAMLETR